MSQPKFFVGDKVRNIPSKIPPELRYGKYGQQRDGGIIQVMLSTRENTHTEECLAHWEGRWCYRVDVGDNRATWYMEDYLELDKKGGKT
jgi:hypothetical protein